MTFRCNVLPVGVHCIQCQNGIGLIHANADGMQERRITSCAFKTCIQHKCRNCHANSVDCTHCTVYEEICAARNNNSPGNFGNHILKEMIRNEGRFHLCVNFSACIVCIIKLLRLRAKEIIGFYLCNALNILHNLADKCYVAFYLVFGNILACPLHFGVNQEENKHADSRNQTDSPVKAQDHKNNHRGFQYSLCCQHDYASGYIAQRFHGVCCY